MAKNISPMRTGGGLGSKLIGGITTVVVLTILVRYHTDVAGWVTAIAQLVDRIVNGLVDFTRQIGGH
jgi:hypothetical protein